MKTKLDMPQPDPVALAELDALFAQARAVPIVPEADFMARIMADAIALQPEAMTPRSPLKRRGFFARLAAALGGALMVAGVGSAAMAGLVIGYVQPEPMLELVADIGLAQEESLELMPSYGLLLDVEAAQ